MSEKHNAATTDALAPALGLGMLLGAVRGVIDFPSAGSSVSGVASLLLNESLCLVVVVAALVWFAVLAAGSLSKRPFVARCSLASNMGGTAALAAVAIGMALASRIAVPDAVVAIAGALFALGVLVLGGAWLRLYAAMDSVNAVRRGAVAVAIAGIVQCVLVASAEVGDWLAVAFFVSASLLLAFCQRRAADRSDSEGEADLTGADVQQSAPDRREVLTRMASILWLPLVGAMIASFIQGLVWDPDLSETASASTISFRTISMVGGPLVAAALVLIALRNGGGVQRLRRLQRLGFPVAMAVLLLYPMVGPTEGLLADIGELLPQTCFALVLVLVWSALVMASRGPAAGSALSWSAASVCLPASFLAGLLLISVIGTGGRDLCLVLLTAYLVLLSVSLAQDTQTERHGRVIDELRPDAFMRRRTEELSAEFGISPREKEVLFYLGRGYNHGYIAKKLFVSENTVRTHVRHIYGKIGVSSREELLDLIDGERRDEVA